MLKLHSESGHCVPESFPLHWRLPGEDLDLWEGMGQESRGYREGGDKHWTPGGARDGTGEEAGTQRVTVLRLVANLITSKLFLSPGCPRHPPRTQTHFVFLLLFSHAHWRQLSFFELICDCVIFWEQTFVLCC